MREYLYGICCFASFISTYCRIVNSNAEVNIRANRRRCRRYNFQRWEIIERGSTIRHLAAERNDRASLAAAPYRRIELKYLKWTYRRQKKDTSLFVKQSSIKWWISVYKFRSFMNNRIFISSRANISSKREKNLWYSKVIDDFWRAIFSEIQLHMCVRKD